MSFNLSRSTAQGRGNWLEWKVRSYTSECRYMYLSWLSLIQLVSSKAKSRVSDWKYWRSQIKAQVTMLPASGKSGHYPNCPWSRHANCPTSRYTCVLTGQFAYLPSNRSVCILHCPIKLSITYMHSQSYSRSMTPPVEALPPSLPHSPQREADPRGGGGGRRWRAGFSSEQTVGISRSQGVASAGRWYHHGVRAAERQQVQYVALMVINLVHSFWRGSCARYKRCTRYKKTRHLFGSRSRPPPPPTPNPTAQ